MNLSDKNLNDIIIRYNERYRQYGYSEKSLGWTKNKQDIRFNVLTEMIKEDNFSILDIGCGFGDINRVLHCRFKNYQYTGIDIIEAFIEEGKKRYSSSDVEFVTGDFLKYKFVKKYDYIVASGIFNHQLSDQSNYEYFESVTEKSIQLARKSISFDFLSDKVDYRLENTFHNSPETILSIAYLFSRRIILRNDYMPFEFSITINKQDSFSSDTTIFNDSIYSVTNEQI